MSHDTLVATVNDSQNGLSIEIMEISEGFFLPFWIKRGDTDQSSSNKTYKSIISAIRAVYVIELKMF